MSEPKDDRCGEGSVNYMHITDDAHCLTCHSDYHPSELKGLPVHCTPNISSCTEKCGRWHYVHPKQEGKQHSEACVDSPMKECNPDRPVKQEGKECDRCKGAGEIDISMEAGLIVMEPCPDCPAPSGTMGWKTPQRTTEFVFEKIGGDLSPSALFIVCTDGSRSLANLDDISRREKELTARFEGRRHEAYEAFHWLIDNHEWAIKSLDVWMSKVDPKTRIRSDKEAENTRHEYWLEGGPFDDETMSFGHDYELDCGGATFEEAIIEYAKLVKKQYGERSELNGTPDQAAALKD